MNAKLESTHRVQTSTKEYALVHNVKVLNNITIKNITRIVSITVNSKVMLFYHIANKQRIP